MTSRVLLLEVTNPLKELLGTSLLEHAHQRGAQSFTGIGGHLGYGRLRALALLDVAASNLLELEVPSDVGGHQNVGQLSVRHEELRDQVDIPVIDPSIFLPRFLAGANVAVFLEQLQKRSAEFTGDILVSIRFRC